jgi:hypothetical protein
MNTEINNLKHYKRMTNKYYKKKKIIITEFLWREHEKFQLQNEFLLLSDMYLW